jgi:hypothetical protein
VLCATCCTPLIWDDTFAIATREQLDALPIEDRATLARLIAERLSQLVLVRGCAS